MQGIGPLKERKDIFISTTGGLLKDVFFSMLRANQEKRNQNSFSKSLTYDPLINTCR